MDLIIIAGMPASGKSTAAEKLGRIFGFPVLEKDALKEELFDTIGFQSYPQKRLLDSAATAVLLRCVEALLSGGTSLIMVNNFREDMREAVQALIDRHACRCVMLFFQGDAEMFYHRYVLRDRAHARHLGHIVQEHYPPREGDPVDHTMSREEFAAKFEKLGMDRFRLNCPWLPVDATEPAQIDIDALAGRIREALDSQESKA